MQIILFDGQKVRLRALEKKDLPNIMEHWNTWESRRNLMMYFPMSELFEEKWLERAMLHNPLSDGQLTLAIEERETKQFVGTISLHDIVPNLKAEIGIAIHNPLNHNKGFGTDAMNVMLWYGFHVLNLHNIMLRVWSTNERAIHVYKKIGFHQAGVLRERNFIEGRYRDEILMDMLQSEFFERLPPGTTISGRTNTGSSHG